MLVAAVKRHMLGHAVYRDAAVTALAATGLYGDALFLEMTEELAAVHELKYNHFCCVLHEKKATVVMFFFGEGFALFAAPINPLPAIVHPAQFFADQ